MNEQKSIRPSDRAGQLETFTGLAVFPGEGGKPITAIVKRTRGGYIRSMLTRVPLNPAKGEVYSMSVWDTQARGYTTKRLITALGYDKLNQFVGVAFIAPETMRGDGGDVHPNPQMMRDNSGELVAVRIRQIGIGRNAQGNLVAHDLTLEYDLQLYFRQDLFSKWTGKKSESVKAWGTLYSSEPKHTAENKKAYKLPGGVYLLVDMNNKDVVHLISEHINRQRFAERNATTICRRNILKKFLGVAYVDESCVVPVVGWPQADRDWQELTDMAADANIGHVIGPDEDITLETSRAVADKDDIDAALAGEGEDSPTMIDEAVDEALAQTASSDDDESPFSLTDKERADIRARIRETANQLDASAKQLAFSATGIRELKAINNIDDGRQLLDVLTAFETAHLDMIKRKQATPGGVVGEQQKTLIE